jgi:hypothetical protein
VELKAPDGSLVSLAIDQQFSAPQPMPLKVGMLVGAVYRLRVSQIPNRLGEEAYPTIEIINRIYPPVGEEFRFPIPIELTQQDLQLALDGKFVTRVVYLEDPQRALPVAKDAESEQTFFEVRPTDDPLEVADRLGRPVAILRLGGRLPESTGPDTKFLFGSPPVLVANSLDLYSEVHQAPTAASDPPPRPDERTSSRRRQSSDEKQQVIYPTRAFAAARPAATVTMPPGGSPVQSPLRSLRNTEPRAVKALVSRSSEADWKLDQPAPAAVSVSDE